MFRALLTAAVVLVTAAGCSSSSANRDGGPGGGGADGAVNCRLLNSTGTDCWCAAQISNSLSECSATSAAGTDHGYCCSGGGFCNCWHTACVNLATIGHCECGSPLDDTSPRVDNCPQPAGGVCCLYTGLTPGDCYCQDSVTSCISGTVQVPSCSLADVTVCGATETMIDRCK